MQAFGSPDMVKTYQYLGGLVEARAADSSRSLDPTIIIPRRRRLVDQPFLQPRALDGIFDSQMTGARAQYAARRAISSIDCSLDLSGPIPRRLSVAQIS